MKKILTLLTATMLLTGSTVAQGAERGRNQGNSNRPNTSGTISRPGNNGRPQGTPGNGNGNQHKPGNQNKPGNQPSGTISRPGNNGRPQGTPNPGHHTPTPPKPNHKPTPPPVNHRPNYGRPTPPPSWHYRPYMPANRPWGRPTPPPSWRPNNGAPVINAILGITLGTALDITLGNLARNGFTVAGYGDQNIYLSNVNQFNFLWPGVTMHFNNGYLVGSEFVYSSPSYDMSRYNVLYNRLVGQYGYPVSTQNQGGSISATWWGYNNGYITLSYYNDYAYNGMMRYFTTLQMGN